MNIPVSRGQQPCSPDTLLQELPVTRDRVQGKPGSVMKRNLSWQHFSVANLPANPHTYFENLWVLTGLAVPMQYHGKGSFAKHCSAPKLTSHEAPQRQHGALMSFKLALTFYLKRGNFCRRIHSLLHQPGVQFDLKILLENSDTGQEQCSHP